MKLPSSTSGRRETSSEDSRSTPSRLHYLHSTSYSDASTTSRKSNSGRNPLATAARSVAGVFLACFTPPEKESAKEMNDSNNFKSPSVASSRGGSTNRGIYRSSYDSSQGRGVDTVKYTMEEIRKATNNFSPSLKIGQGGFGTVYKGNFENGVTLAIKRAKKGMHDKHLGSEFNSEIQTLARVEHLNLVKFYGYIEHEDERIVIVEYVPNGNLREHLDCMRGTVLDLSARLDIGIDVAHALTYLHMYTDHPIIHRDIKSSNILITENLRAKVADFGFARLAADTDSGATHVSTQVKGTAGYLDPEYLRTYQLTEKSDVFSFGVLLVELITGRRPIQPKRELKERITVKWAMKKFSDGDAISILDPKLEQTPANNLAIEKILELSLKCMAPNRPSRPSMKRCVEILWGIRKDFKDLSSDLQSASINSQRRTFTKDTDLTKIAE